MAMEAKSCGWKLLIGVIIASVVLIALFLILRPNEQPGFLQLARVNSTKSALTEIAIQLNRFKEDCGFFPSSRQGLNALSENPQEEPKCKNWKGPYGSTQLKDTWGSDFVYSSEGQSFVLKSLGRDKKEGGVGYDADIVVNSSWPPETSNSK
jgi:general secretion pathway protein G